MRKKALPGPLSMLIRSIIFFIIVPVYTAIYCVFCLLSMPFPLRYRFQVVMGWLRSMIWFSKVICCMDYQIKGLENIDRSRPAVIMSKHSSAWETFFIPPQFNQTAIILKKELLYLPFFGWGMLACDPIIINRSNKASAMSQVISKGKKYLQDGRWVLVFPEGTRIAPGQVGKYRLGGARLAVDAGAPILPVAHNAGYFWSKRK
jgi:1-acyl-sn-glycerol-3-phosphate acyltransferase